MENCNSEYIKLSRNNGSEITLIVIKNILKISIKENIVVINYDVVEFTKKEDAIHFFTKIGNYLFPETKKQKQKESAEKTKPFRNSFEHFYFSKFGVKYAFDVKDNTALKSIVNKLQILNNKSEENLDNLFKLFITQAHLHFLNDKFLKSKFVLTMVNNQYNEIIQKTKTNVVKDGEKRSKYNRA